MAIGSRRLVASILVIGLLSVALSLVCSDVAHLPVLGGADGKCAVVDHTDIVPATIGSESSATLVSQLLVLGSGFALFLLVVPTTAHVTLVGVVPNPPPDPMNGVLRI